jgi:beta-lactamase regulating signal transducer with metallopeptidase domain
MLMILLPLVMTLATVDLFTRTARRQATGVVERTVGLPAFVQWRGRIVRGAGILWAAGLVVGTVRVAGAWRRDAAVRRTEAIDPGPSLRQIVATLRADLGVTRPVTILLSRLAEVPLVFGWRRSTILMPVSTSNDLDMTQLRAVIAHEIAHVRRRDYAANLLQVAADVTLWFHPAARWLSRRARIEREYCCDDVAVGLAADRADYARALARLEEARHDCPLVIAAASGTLLDRIQRVVGQPRPRLTPARAAAGLALAIAIASILATLAQVVPPAVPLDARLRSRAPAPPDGASTRTPGPMVPRVPQR